MTSSGIVRSISTRSVKKLERPRPLKSTISAAETHTKSGQLDYLMCLVETVSQTIINSSYDDTLKMNILALSEHLKSFGSQLEPVYEDQLDRAFVSFRNGTRDENLDYKSRMALLELIELRAKKWQKNEDLDDYYSKFSVSLDPFNLPNVTLSNSEIIVPTLSPGEVLKKSGRFSKPTKVQGKNYCKDEVVIRNADSGKVMGIKGRRVHMIEELSETIISFQRVNPGAKERLVQITGPTEDKIIHARQLMEDTIRRNASPIREMSERERMGGSSSSLNSSASDDSNRFPFPGRGKTLLHSLSTPDASIGEYKYSVTVGNDTIKITGTNHDLVRVAKLVLDEHFSLEPYQNYRNDCYTHYEEDVFTNPSHMSLSKRMGSLDLGNGASNSSVEVDYGYGINRQPIYTQPIRPVLSRSASVHSQEFKDFSTKQDKKVYSIEFLMNCSESPLCKLPPFDWDRISKEYPAIVKQEPYFIDAKAVLKRRNEVKQRTIAQINLSPEPE